MTKATFKHCAYIYAQIIYIYIYIYTYVCVSEREIVQKRKIQKKK